MSSRAVALPGFREPSREEILKLFTETLDEAMKDGQGRVFFAANLVEEPERTTGRMFMMNPEGVAQLLVQMMFQLREHAEYTDEDLKALVSASTYND